MYLILVFITLFISILCYTNMFFETLQHSLDIFVTLSRSSLQFFLDSASHFLGLLLETQTSLLNTLQLQRKVKLNVTMVT